MNANEFSNETIIPVSIFESYRRWDADRRAYVIDERVDPGNPSQISIRLGARNHAFLGKDHPIGKWVLHMAGLEADVVRHMADLGSEMHTRMMSLENISEKVIAALRDQSVSDTDICEIFETINEDLPTGFELTPPVRKWRVRYTASINNEIEDEVEIEATSAEHAEELFRENPDDYVDLHEALIEHVRYGAFDTSEFDIDCEASEA